MISNKLFVIKDSYFNLPDDFEGTCGEALMLLAKYRLEKEKINNICIDDSIDNPYENLIENDNIKCTIKYNLLKLSEDKTKWLDIN